MPKRTSIKANLTQAKIRRGVEIGPLMDQVSPVMFWYKSKLFKNEDQALGAFELAYQQALDGMGTSVQGWMGLNSKQLDAWMRKNQLPKLK
jgi:hypothetical protein